MTDAEYLLLNEYSLNGKVWFIDSICQKYYFDIVNGKYLIQNSRSEPILEVSRRSFFKLVRLYGNYEN